MLLCNFSTYKMHCETVFIAPLSLENAWRGGQTGKTAKKLGQKSLWKNSYSLTSRSLSLYDPVFLYIHEYLKRKTLETYVLVPLDTNKM